MASKQAFSSTSNVTSLLSSTVLLITSDQQYRSISSYKLAAQSQIFEDLFQIPSQGPNEIPIAESAAVLDALLPYCSHGRLAPFDLDDPLAWSLMNAFDKYNIGRGLDAVTAAIDYASDAEGMALSEMVFAYFFAVYFDVDSIDIAALRIIDYGSANKARAVLRRFAQKEGVSDGGKLSRLFDRRKRIVDEKRSGELAEAMAAKFMRAAGADWGLVGRMMSVWSDSSRCSTLDELRTLQHDSGLSRTLLRKLLPWSELEAVLAALPTKLNK